MIFAQRPLRDILMSRGKNSLLTVSRQFVTRNYPRPNCLLKCLANCLSPAREFFFVFQNCPPVRAIAKQLRDKNCLAAILSRHIKMSLLAHWVLVENDLADADFRQKFRQEKGAQTQTFGSRCLPVGWGSST